MIDSNGKCNDVSLASIDSNKSNCDESNDINLVSSSQNDENGNILALGISIENSVNETTINGTTAQPDSKATRRRVKWIPRCNFDTYTEAKDFLVGENFKRYDSKQCGKGNKTFWRCGRIKQRSKEQCEAKRMIFQDNCKMGFEMFVANTEHTCDKIGAIHHTKSISNEMKDVIISCAANRMTTKSIVKHFDELREKLNVFKNEKTPSESQIAYIVRKHKQTKTPKMLFLGELIEWCEKNTEVPEDIDTPFVIGFEHSDESDALNFKIVVSTKRMIEHCIDIEKLCVDATYKLNWNGFPFMVVGTVDRVKKFHPLCFALCVHETTDDFRFIFDALKATVFKLTETVFKPRILISDAALAIRNAFALAFPDYDFMVMCFVHVLRNVEKNKDKYKKENKQEIIKDILIMQLAASRETFDMLAVLFIAKWTKREKVFAAYFKKTWLDSHCNWFEGVGEYTPSTNNSLEGNFIYVCTQFTMNLYLFITITSNF